MLFVGYKIIYYINIDCCILYTQSFLLMWQITSYCILKRKTNNFTENYSCIWVRYFCI